MPRWKEEPQLRVQQIQSIKEATMSKWRARRAKTREVATKAVASNNIKPRDV